MIRGKVGKQVLWIGTTKENPRNGEGAFARLKDGSILYLYTQFCEANGDDHGGARLCACFSRDEGETWTEPAVMIEKDEKAQNIMSPTLFRMKNGLLGVAYDRKEYSPDGALYCIQAFSFSEDEGKTWSPWKPIYPEKSYYCMVNDCALVQKNGRIVIPVGTGGDGYRYFGSGVVNLISDDHGETWSRLPQTILSPYSDSWNLQEPGLLELDDGTLWEWFRTGYGYQYQSFSRDGGESWTRPEPNLYFSSPDSPMRVKRVGKFAVAVYNPMAYNAFSGVYERWGSVKRAPLLCAVSEDGGRSFDSTGQTVHRGFMEPFEKRLYALETELECSYCYPAIQETKDGFLVAYYHSDGGACLNCMKMVKVYFDELT